MKVIVFGATGMVGQSVRGERSKTPLYQAERRRMWAAPYSASRATARPSG